jgi:hypothetical protein
MPTSVPSSDTKTTSTFIAACAILIALAGTARAAGDGVDAPGSPAAARVERTAASGNFLLLTQGAALDGQGGHATASGGYDGSRRAGLFEAAAEVRLWGPVVLRGGAVYTGDDRTLRPSFGARLQALHESRHGVDGAVGVFYRPEGLTEGEGEIEAVVSAGTHLGATYLLGNLVYGQDGEGRERDGEVRLAALRPVTRRLLLGFDGRLRFDLGSDRPGRSGSEPTLDALVGPAATFLAGPVALLVHAGASALRVPGGSTAGAFVLGGIGTSF